MTFDEYQKEHLQGQSGEFIRLVRMGWNARGTCGDTNESSVTCHDAVTEEMIEAGAQRLVAWEDGSVWPGSWDSMTVAAARNDAERVIRSALSAADHIADASKMAPKGDVAMMGDITDDEGNTVERSLLVHFATREDFYAAVSSGQCRFSVFGGDL